MKKLLDSKSPIPQNCSARLQRWKLRLSCFNFSFIYIKGVENVTSDFLSRHPLNVADNHVEPYDLIFVVENLNASPITVNDISVQTNANVNLRKLKEYIKFGFPDKCDKFHANFKGYENYLSIFKDCIMFKNRVFVPENLRRKMLEQFHKGHPGIVAMKSLCRSLVWYPGIDRDITDMVSTCKECMSVRAKPSQSNIVQWPEPHKKWSRIHVDHYFYQGYIFLIVVDALTRYIECEIVPSVSSADTISCLRLIFSRNGLPDTVVSDNATNFVSAEMKQFFDDNVICHLTPPPYCPYSNGQAERAVLTFKNLLKKNDVGTIRTRLANVLLYYRNTPCSVTGIAPSVALNGRVYVTVKERINPHYTPNIKSSKYIRMFKIGDDVLAINLRSGPKWYHAVIKEKLAVNMYSVYIKDLDTIWRRHANQLLPCSNAHSYTVDNRNIDLNVDSRACKLPDLEKPVSCKFSDYVSREECKLSGSSVVDSNEPNSNSRVNSPIETEVNVDNSATVPLVPLRRSTRVSKPVDRYQS